MGSKSLAPLARLPATDGADWTSGAPARGDGRAHGHTHETASAARPVAGRGWRGSLSLRRTADVPAGSDYQMVVMKHSSTTWHSLAPAFGMSPDGRLTLRRAVHPASVLLYRVQNPEATHRPDRGWPNGSPNTEQRDDKAGNRGDSDREREAPGPQHEPDSSADGGGSAIYPTCVTLSKEGAKSEKERGHA
jgi:hypothetical protein